MGVQSPDKLAAALNDMVLNSVCTLLTLLGYSRHTVHQAVGLCAS